MKHVHAHRHQFPHPDAYGRSTWVTHEHEHNHSKAVTDIGGHEPYHRPHRHTIAEEIELRRRRKAIR